ncbi:ricin-type beta-trefoil lectin domain protein [Streptomyces olivaceoviridis]|uniref:ricin-type beta-trefoil lectin domain protein n=1 Tax=Streptomyces olivaceoviridis TaxID=1921 RepID=UPI0036A0D847
MSEPTATPAEYGRGSAAARPGGPAGPHGAGASIATSAPTPAAAAPQPPTSATSSGAGPAPAAATTSLAEAGIGGSAAAAVPDMSTAPTATAGDPPVPPSGSASPDPGSHDKGRAGRMSPGVLAGAALAGLLLVATPFVLGQLSRNSSPDHRTKASGPRELEITPDDADPGFVPVPAASSGVPHAQALGPDVPRSGGKPGRVGAGRAGAAPSGTPAPSAGTGDAAKPTTKPAAASGTKSAASANDNSSRTSATRKPPSPAPQPAKVELVSKLNDKCLDATDSNFTPGNPVQMWTCLQRGNQYWQFYPDGTLRAGGLCITSESTSNANGSPVHLERCDNRPQQQWVLGKGENIVNPASTKCLEIVDVNRNDRARLQLWSCNGQTHQNWYKR